MRFSTSALVLSTLAIGQAAAASMLHGKQHNHAARHVEILKAHHERRDLDRRDSSSLLAEGASDILTGLGFKSLGLNPIAPGNTPWAGTGGTFTNNFINTSGEDLILVVWGAAGSWVNAVQPQLTVSIPATNPEDGSNGNQTISFPIGWSGAWAPVHSASTLVNGQISDTWGEGTFNPPYSVVDVSREVNMNGKNMSIVTPKCTSDMNTCVFKCSGGASVCLYDYELVNCATGSQSGANFGTYEGAASGGCGGMGNSAALTTYLG